MHLWHVSMQPVLTCVKCESRCMENCLVLWIFLGVQIRSGETVLWPKGSTVWQRRLTRTRLVPFLGPTDFLQAQSCWFSLLAKFKNLCQFGFYEQWRTNWQKFCNTYYTQNSVCVKENFCTCLYKTELCQQVHSLVQNFSHFKSIWTIETWSSMGHVNLTWNLIFLYEWQKIVPK